MSLVPNPFTGFGTPQKRQPDPPRSSEDRHPPFPGAGAGAPPVNSAPQRIERTKNKYKDKDVVEIEKTMPFPTSIEQASRIYREANTQAVKTHKKEDMIRAGIAHDDMFAIVIPGWRGKNPYSQYLYPKTEQELAAEAQLMYEKASGIRGGRISRKTRGKRKSSRRSKKTRRH